MSHNDRCLGRREPRYFVVRPSSRQTSGQADLHFAQREHAIVVLVQTDRHGHCSQAGVPIVRHGAQVSVPRGLRAYAVARVVMLQATGPDALQLLLGQQKAPTLALDGTILDLGRCQRLQERSDSDAPAERMPRLPRQASRRNDDAWAISDCGFRIADSRGRLLQSAITRPSSVCHCERSEAISHHAA